MGMYLNIGNAGFQSIRKGLYVDKSGLISYINSTLGTEDKLTCVSRPRRFGKSFAAKMLCAYYDKSCNSSELFHGLKIEQDSSYLKYLNKFDVLYLDITWFISTAPSLAQSVSFLQEQVITELCSAYPEIAKEHSLPVVLAKISRHSSQRFIIIIDEWDALFREAKQDERLQQEYIQLLRGLFKSSQTDIMIEAAYMTGILPIKKYGTQSALTDFREYTMLNPQMLAEYAGFTESEAKALCEAYQFPFEDAKKWYDGYSFSRLKSVYSPNSIIRAVKSGEIGGYWTETETYESLKYYIGMNEDGLKDAIISMVGGMRCKINTRTFQNDLSNIRSRDDVLTLLVHLGYLAYDSASREVCIPNQEIADEFQNAVEYSGWEGISAALQESEKLVDATIRQDAAAVADGIDRVHSANTSIIAYHNELSLSCVITIAYYAARKDYTFIRELPAGKGFADIALIPGRHTDKPAMLIELKWNKSAEGALQQIHEKKYCGVLQEYADRLLLVGINYNKKTKLHECSIEIFKNTLL